ncbi:ammonia-forming cytochrome c nitrite reductase subunit c552 [Fundidesulfovibrio putealis]|uniref:ammonia-forming cytochrome c nitrite reductase subunit c552 n=1 Tax=Fundidesulfovibrio putealis TaxID=270496 RepID=UPI00042A054B|nr:ammonia-forming cytochrome c nitrite reductase subunit c552 [Fundidesulfovibrio putealis]
MKRASLFLAMLAVLAVLAVTACGGGGGEKVNVAEVTSKPKVYVGSDRCKSCHLEHFDSWMMTLHSRMLGDARKDKDVIIADLNPDVIRADLAKLQNLKVKPEDFYIPKPEEVLYTIGSQWKQRYVVEKNGMLVIAPIQYNSDTGRWVNYNEATWDKSSWILKCGGCHATGVDLAKNTFEPSVGCEACHGPGSWHTALPKAQVFDKRATIVNPAKLTSGVAAQICGSCHNRGKATKNDKAEWPVGYLPGKALETYFKSTSFAGGDAQHLYGNEFSKAHHQQYIDWKQSKHFAEGVMCTSCHYVHELGIGKTRFQTRESGSKQCLSCHTRTNSNQAHAIHSFGNCLGCHMPRVVTSAESGDLHSHVFKTLLPKETLKDPKIPNSCVKCHHHAKDDLATLQQKYDALAQLPRPQGKVIDSVDMIKAGN